MTARVTEIREQLHHERERTSALSREILGLMDLLDDTLNGIAQWRAAKENDWTDRDEVLLRWLAGGPLDAERLASHGLDGGQHP